MGPGKQLLLDHQVEITAHGGSGVSQYLDDVIDLKVTMVGQELEDECNSGCTLHPNVVSIVSRNVKALPETSVPMAAVAPRELDSDGASLVMNPLIWLRPGVVLQGAGHRSGDGLKPLDRPHATV